jgi:DNA adenine methylase
MPTPFVLVRPVSPPAGYIGGKRNLSRRICAIIEATPHTSYAEPFVGMGGIFLRRARRPRAEAINDISCCASAWQAGPSSSACSPSLPNA